MPFKMIEEARKAKLVLELQKFDAYLAVFMEQRQNYTASLHFVEEIPD